MGQIRLNEDWKIDSNKYRCPICNKIYSKMGISTHIWRTHKEGKNHNPNNGFKKGRNAWNKGLTKKSDNRILKQANKISEEYKSGKRISSWTGRKHTVETIKLMKEKCGGIRKGSGRGKSGWYKGYWCDSSWELAWVIFNLENNVKFERNKKSFKYIYENEEYNFYPDFIIEDTYYEIKGYMDNKNKAKLKYFKEKIKIVDKESIKPFLEYTIKKYGKDFIKLYEPS